VGVACRVSVALHAAGMFRVASVFRVVAVFRVGVVFRGSCVSYLVRVLFHVGVHRGVADEWVLRAGFARGLCAWALRVGVARCV
jgi:hypothetical protein